MDQGTELAMRPATDADRPQIIGLLCASLGWQAQDEFKDLFEWKHLRNPFGPSPGWVAADGDRIVGFRTMLRWEFSTAATTFRAVRAVDTATHPDYQGRGIFSRLTRQALAELTTDGVDCVFNTPNAQSQPGYLKMGWQIVGRIPVAMRPRSARSLVRMLRAHQPAERWSVETPVGLPADEGLTDREGLARLLASQPPTTGLRTRLSPSFLSWRYAGLRPLAYRVLTRTTSVDEGFIVFRLRRRGHAIEAVVAIELAPDGDLRALGRVVRSLPSRTGCDYAIRAGRARSDGGFWPLPRQGPTLTCRPLGGFQAPPLAQWHLGLGDLELF
jgi:GNAT superfamily N-acetyltransferase